MSEPTRDSMCVLPWTHLHGSVDGVWARCCVDTSVHHDDLYRSRDRPRFDLNDDALGCAARSPFAVDNPGRVLGVDAAFNSAPMRATRLAMLAGESVAACAYCYRREDGGGRSYRQTTASELAPYADPAVLRAATAADGSVARFPIFLDIRFGNTCNLACVMCGYPTSSRWGIDQHPEWAPAHIDPYSADDGLWDALRANATTIRKLYFAGGEPMLQAGHFRLVDLMIELGVAHRIDLAYNTNLTVLPADFLPRLGQFASAGIGASCDGTGELFERIRVGGRWNVFVANLRRVKRHASSVWLAVAPQRDNVMHLGDIIDFADVEGVAVDLTNLVHWPERLSLAALPPNERDEVAEHLAQLTESYDTADRPDVARQVAMVGEFVRSASGPRG